MKQQVIEIPDGYELKQEGNTYTIVKKETKLPKSWKELGEISGWYVNTDSSVCDGAGYYASDENPNVFRTKEQAEAAIALAQLTQLVHVWREGWEPDWTNYNTDKYIIELRREKIVVDSWTTTHYTILSFGTKEKAQKFLETFEDLIKKAVPLLWGVTIK